MTSLPGSKAHSRGNTAVLTNGEAGQPACPKGALWAAASGVLVLIAIALRAVWPVNHDVSWLLELAQRTLDGAVPYRDFLEVNPPASILIYMPAVILSRLTGTSPERMTDALVFLATPCSLATCAGILNKAKLIAVGTAPALGLIGLSVLLILPLNSFAQREHIAVLAMLPILATFAARTSGVRPRPTDIVLAGIGTGIAMSIKPMFVLALIGPIFNLLRCRSWREVFREPELCIAGCLASFYGLGIVLLVPDFTARVLPLVMRVYVPARLSLLELTLQSTVLVWAALCYGFWRLRRPNGNCPVGDTLIFASVGFEAVFFLQGKAFPYHGYPSIALAALAYGSALSMAAASGGKALLHHYGLDLALAASLSFAGFWTFAEWYDADSTSPGLRQAIAAISAHPRMLAVTGDLTVGRSFAREMGGKWVGSEQAAWITLYANAIQPHAEENSRFADAIRMEREVYAGDIERQRPDVILIDGGGWWRWTRHSASLVRALTFYQRVGQFGDVTLWSRKPLLPAVALEGSATQSAAIPGLGAISPAGAAP